MVGVRTVVRATLVPLLTAVLVGTGAPPTSPAAGAGDGAGGDAGRTEPVVEAPPVEVGVPTDPALDPAAPEPVDAATLATTLAPLLQDPALGPSPTVSVRDLATGAEVVQRAATQPVEPASVAKLVTAAAALDVLGAERRLTTRVGWVPAAERDAGRPALVLVGGGDLLLAAGEGDPAAVDGRVGLADLARAAVLAVTEGAAAERLLPEGTATVDVVVDDSLLGGPQELQRAARDSLFAATPASLAVDGGRLGTGTAFDADPAATAGRAFADALEASLADVLAGAAPDVGGVEVVTAPVTTTATVAEGTSARLADVLAFLLVTSDNTVADSVAGLVAAERGETTTLAAASVEVVEVVEELGADLAGTSLTDGSGLSDGSLSTAAGMTDLLALAAAAPDGSDLGLLPQLLPVAGLEGTLADRFDRGSSAADGRGVVRAKTGTLTGTTSLAGVVTARDGRGLAFAVMSDQVPPTDTLAARAAVDRIAAAVADCC